MQAKIQKKFFCLPGNIIWIGIVKLSLLRKGFFSSAVSVLTSSSKIWHLNERDFFRLNWLGRVQWIWWRCCHTGFNSAWARLPCSLSKGPLNRHFLDIYLTTFFESVILDIQKRWGSSFFSKYWKFNLDFKNAGKNSEKDFCFWGNSIWIGNVKVSLLKTGYFSSATSVLTSSLKI